MKHQLVNRGFLYGPYLPIYGFGALLLLLLLRPLMKQKAKILNFNIIPIIVFIAVFIITTVVEYIGHYVLDKGFGIILWDYSKDFFNINGRVCFAASRNFAIGGTVCLYLFQPIFDKIIISLNNNIKNILFIILFGIVMIDLFITCFL